MIEEKTGVSIWDELNSLSKSEAVADKGCALLCKRWISVESLKAEIITMVNKNREYKEKSGELFYGAIADELEDLLKSIDDEGEKQ